MPLLVLLVTLLMPLAPPLVPLATLPLPLTLLVVLVLVLVVVVLLFLQLLLLLLLLLLSLLLLLKLLLLLPLLPLLLLVVLMHSCLLQPLLSRSTPPGTWVHPDSQLPQVEAPRNLGLGGRAHASRPRRACCLLPPARLPWHRNTSTPTRPWLSQSTP